MVNEETMRIQVLKPGLQLAETAGGNGIDDVWRNI